MLDDIATKSADPAIDVLQDVRMEKALMGALLSNSGLIEHLPLGFLPEHYSDPFHAEVHRVIAGLAQPSLAVADLVIQHMTLAGDERAYVAHLIGAAPSYSRGAVKAYAEAVTDLYRRRGLHSAGIQIQQDALAPRDSGRADAAIGRAISKLDALASAHEEVGHVSLTDAIDAAMARADMISSGQLRGLSTGIRCVDDALGSLLPGSLIVLAGRPSMGKSALGFQIAINVAMSGSGVLVVSLEMSNEDLGVRGISGLADTPADALFKGKHAPYIGRLLEARAKTRSAPMTMVDRASLTPTEIGVAARSAKRRHGLGLIVIDHLHIIRPERGDEKHGGTYAIGRITGAIKRLAKDCGCPVLLLAQLSRAVEAREDKRPTLSDLRQSGDIEQDADVVGFLYRSEYYLSRSEPQKSPGETREKFATRLSQWEQDLSEARGKAELIVAKVRNGAPSTAHLSFRAGTSFFADPRDE